MAAKKAAKKSAAKKALKKAAKKGPKHHDEHRGGKDLRRAYEHLGRLEALQASVPGAAVTSINTLIQMARTSLRGDESRAAADLLRACEHLAFGALASTAKDAGVGDALREAIGKQYEELIERAADHWDEYDVEPSGTIASIYEKAFDDAEKAYTKGAYRRALEYARAAEALSHVGDVGHALPAGDQIRKLK